MSSVILFPCPADKLEKSVYEHNIFTFVYVYSTCVLKIYKIYSLQYTLQYTFCIYKVYV